MNDIETWVSAEFARLAQVINDYDHNLFLEMVPVAEQANLIDKSKVFRIIDDRTKTIVMYADSLSNSQAILVKLWTIDQKYNDPVALMDAQNAAAEALKNQEIIEQREAQKDLSAFIIKNTKSRWTHDGRVRDDEFRDLGPVRKVIE